MMIPKLDVSHVSSPWFVENRSSKSQKMQRERCISSMNMLGLSTYSHNKKWGNHFLDFENMGFYIVLLPQENQVPKLLDPNLSLNRTPAELGDFEAQGPAGTFH